jgi:tetratricopeptide (TPR) repeat protein
VRHLAQVLRHPTPATTDLALTVHRLAVDRTRELASDGSEQLNLSLARRLVEYATVVAEVGSPTPEALDSAAEAVSLCEGSVGSGVVGEAARRTAADALLATAAWPSADRATAAATVQRAVDLLRPIAEARQGAHLPDLAQALELQADCSEGRKATALLSEATSIYQRLADEAPDRFLPSLAAALHRWATSLTAVGDWRAASSKLAETARIHEALCQTRPLAFLALHADVLDELADALDRCDRPYPAVAAARRAVSVHRRLAAEHPASGVAGLLDALRRLADRLGDVGRLVEAEQISAEIVGWCRIPGADPDARDRLAQALGADVLWLGRLGHWARSASLCEELVDLCRGPGDQGTAVDGSALVAALTSLSACYAESGLFDESLAVAAEAVEVCRHGGTRRQH